MFEEETENTDNDMHIGARPIIFTRAVNLRNSMTQSEQILWEELRNKKLGGYKFRRQHPILKYILDFYCHKYKLAIELDGSIHDRPEQIEIDKNRSIDLEKNGLIVMRFRNREVESNIEKVKSEILLKIKELKG